MKNKIARAARSPRQINQAQKPTAILAKLVNTDGIDLVASGGDITVRWSDKVLRVASC